MRNIKTRQLLLILNQLDSLCIEIWDNQAKEYLDIDTMLNEAREARLEELRYALEDESMSYGELIELQGLIPYIEPGDVQLLEAAGVPEFPEEEETPPAYVRKEGWQMAVDALYRELSDLNDFDTTNIEYLRGCCELLARIDGVPEVDTGVRAEQIALKCGIAPQVVSEMYGRKQ